MWGGPHAVRSVQAMLDRIDEGVASRRNTHRPRGACPKCPTFGDDHAEDISYHLRRAADLRVGGSNGSGVRAPSEQGLLRSWPVGTSRSLQSSERADQFHPASPWSFRPVQARRQWPVAQSLWKLMSWEASEIIAKASHNASFVKADPRSLASQRYPRAPVDCRRTLEWQVFTVIWQCLTSSGHDRRTAIKEYRCWMSWSSNSWSSPRSGPWPPGFDARTTPSRQNDVIENQAADDVPHGDHPSLVDRRPCKHLSVSGWFRGLRKRLRRAYRLKWLHRTVTKGLYQATPGH